MMEEIFWIGRDHRDKLLPGYIRRAEENAWAMKTVPTYGGKALIRMTSRPCVRCGGTQFYIRAKRRECVFCKKGYSNRHYARSREVIAARRKCRRDIQALREAMAQGF
jgi:hypothetical protein